MQWKRVGAALAVIGLAFALLIIAGGPAQAQLPGNLPGAPPVPGADLAGLGAPAWPPQPANPGRTNLVISQVYGGGGLAGAPYTNDFIELFNPTTLPIALNGWSVQHAPAAGAIWTATNLPNATIPAGGYFLIREASSGANGAPLPTPDATGSINLGPINGKIALVNTTTALSGACPLPNASIIDFVGYGSATCFEGTGPVLPLSNVTSAQRNGNGCVDTDNNVTDFTVAAPAPRNSASPHTICGLLPTATATLPGPQPSNTPTLPAPLPSNTATPLPTATATRTRTPTITPTNSATATRTTNATATNTVTQTPSATVTTTRTATATNTVTQTPLATSTATLTSSATSTTTRTATATNTVTQTSSATSTATRTATATSTLTPALTATRTATAVPPTATQTATIFASATPTVCGAPIVITGSIDANDPTLPDRISRDGVASTCAAPKTCPGGIGGGGPYHYDNYTFTNTSGAQVCVTVAFTNTCALSIESAAYLTSFDPTTPCTNYLADLGDSPPNRTQYSFNVPAGATFVVVVNEVNPGLGCASYTMTVSGLNACTTPTAVPATSTVTATPATGTATRTSTPAPPTSTLTPTSTPTCSPSGSYHILIVHSDAAATPPATLRSQMLAEPGVAAVDYFDAGASTPTLAQLQQYDLVLQYSGTQMLNNPAALGDVLANYQDGGGVVVAANQDWLNISGFTLQGRWMTGGYTPFTYPATLVTGLTSLGAYNAAHPLMQGVTTLTAFYRLQVGLTVGATGVATYTDSLPLIAVKTTGGHTAVAINAYLGDAAGPNTWNGQFGRVIVNAARWLRPAPPCLTASPTPTATAVSTATPTRTATGTATATATSAAIPTTTNTATLTPGPTTTPVPSPTVGPSMTPPLPTDTPPASTPTALPTGTPVNTPQPPTGTPIASTATPVNTPQPPTGTPIAPTATPTVCVMTFSDVNPGYWAYGYIKWAYCHGIVSGYADNTFRPENNTTRAQIAKMVVLAAGFPLVLPPGAPHFSDVPPGSPFYMVVEVAYAHGVISGYGDGTFRPYQYVTRAQLAKMIVVARGLPLLTPATPTFVDVPAGYWAYSYIETATAHNIVGGYDCGGLGEPCPGRYYRPNTYATRAQLGKMLYQAFGLPTWVVGRP